MIIDPRFTLLADGLTGFSTALKKGERVLIDAFDVPDAMVIALVRAARARGAFPYVQLHLSLIDIWKRVKPLERPQSRTALLRRAWRA